MRDEATPAATRFSQVVRVHRGAENASAGLSGAGFYGAGGPEAESRVSGGMVGQFPAPPLIR